MSYKTVSSLYSFNPSVVTPNAEAIFLIVHHQFSRFVPFLKQSAWLLPSSV